MPEASAPVGPRGHGPRFDVTSLGEPLIRLSVGSGRRLATAASLDVHVGGAELNVCAAMAGLGRRVGWMTKLPRSPLGELVVHRARAWGVDVDACVFTDGGRVGTYYVELATPPLPTRVLYDRAGSAFSGVHHDEVDWDYLLDTHLLHLTGITPALAPNARDAVVTAMERARDRGVRVSFDVNFRASLWSAQEAADVLAPLARKASVLLCGRADAVRLFGLDGSDDDVLSGLRERSGAELVVLTLGANGAIAATNDRILRRPAVPVAVVDRIGAGDAFAAGVLDGVLDGDPERGLALGAGLAAFALSQRGDAVHATRQEVDALLQGHRADVER